MLSDEFLTRLFSNEEMQKIPIGCQSTAIHAVEEVLEQIKEENKYATVSELFEPTIPTTD